MNKEFFEALAMLEKEKGIPMQYLIEKIEAAISIAIKRDENGAEDNVVEINPETGRFYVAVRKTVVEEIEDPANEILKAEAAKYNKTAAVGDIIEIPLETKDFGRIAAQAAKHVIRQGIREAERERIMQEYQSHCNDIITATVLRTDAKTGNVTLELVNKTEAVLPKSEQVPGETFADGQRIRVYVMDVFAGDKGSRFPYQDGSLVQEPGCGRRGRLHRPQGHPCIGHRGRAGRREDRCSQVLGGYPGVHRCGPGSG